IPPADAASSLLRWRQVVVAGDPHQLPPTTFFTSDPEEEEADGDVEDQDGDELAVARELALTSNQESILDVLKALLPPPYGTRVLNWHYRSLDERLIAFSNAQESLYDWSLTTFPGASLDTPIAHVGVPFRPGLARGAASNPDEVDKVVELVRSHS